MRRADLPLYVLGLMVPLVPLSILWLSHQPVGEWLEWYRGERAPVEAVAFTLTPLGAIAAVLALFLNGRAADKTLKQSVQAERATRFQKSAELMANDKIAANTSGVHLMRGLALEDRSYFAPVLHSLVTYAGALDREGKAAMQSFPRSFDDESRRPMDSTLWQMSDRRAADVLTVIGSLSPERGAWPNFPDIMQDGRLSIADIYLNGYHFTSSERLRHIHFVQLSLNAVRFIGCDFEGTIFEGVIGQNVVFEHCNLRNATFILHTPIGAPITRLLGSPHAPLFQQCVVAGARFRGRSLDEVIAEVNLDLRQT